MNHPNHYTQAIVITRCVTITHINEESTSDRTYQQVKMTLWHAGCWTLQTTDAHPGTHIIEKSLYPAKEIVKGDFVVATDGETGIDEFIEAINACRVVTDLAVLKQSRERARIVVNYASESSIVPEIIRSEFMPIAPVHITEGKEHWRVMVEVDALSDVLESMKTECDVEIEAIEQVDPQESIIFSNIVNQIDKTLSPRQREVLFDAREEGYYNWPRDVTANEVADNIGISGPTFLEHLRQGEQKIIHTALDRLEAQNNRL